MFKEAAMMSMMEIKLALQQGVPFHRPGIKFFGCCRGTRDPLKRIERRLTAGNPLAKIFETNKKEEKNEE
jgi:hypothetical protein